MSSSRSTRLSDSPRRTPIITHGLQSPAQSVAGMVIESGTMDSVHTQADTGLRTIDFFDGDSDEELVADLEAAEFASDLDQLQRQGSISQMRRATPTKEPFATDCEGSDLKARPSYGYSRLSPSGSAPVAADRPDTSSTSFNGSVDELLPSAGLDMPSTFHSSPPSLPPALHVADAKKRRQRQPSQVLPSSQVLSSGDRQSRTDHLLGAHALAHEITLQALMRDEDALEAYSLAPLRGRDRRSLLTPSLRAHDPRSPRGTSSTPSKAPKKVQVIPPPIDTSAPYQSLQAIVRTPYPLSPNEYHDRESNRASSRGIAVPRPPPKESILYLHIRRRNHSATYRSAQLIVPAPNDFSAARANGTGEKELTFKAADFDDAEFFRHLRQAYQRLSGPGRFFSARTLKRIAVSGAASCAADSAYVRHLSSMRDASTSGRLSPLDSVGDERIWQLYRHPSLGRARYDFVNWAHHLASAPSSTQPIPSAPAPVTTSAAQDTAGSRSLPTPSSSSEAEAITAEAAAEAADTSQVDTFQLRDDPPEGLELVMGWSGRRIGAALAGVLALAIAAALLWIFLGTPASASAAGGRRRPSEPMGGFRGAGDRVSAGVLVGICVLLLGLSGIGGWVGLSWLVM